MAIRLMALLGPACLALAGCALSWEDEAGTRHVLGLGYHALPARPQEDGAHVEGIDTAGLSLVATGDGLALTLGLRRERRVILPADGAVTVRCLDCAPDQMKPIRIDPVPGRQE